jgi:hypothetical protein
MTNVRRNSQTTENIANKNNEIKGGKEISTPEEDYSLEYDSVPAVVVV